MKATNCFKSGCYVRDETVVTSFDYDQIHIFIHNGMKDGRSKVKMYCKKFGMTSHFILSSADCQNISN